MNIVIFDITYLALHLLLFLAIIRRMEIFHRESHIFLFHLISFLFLFVIQLYLLPSEAPLVESLSYLIFALSIHGIYSVSFLELWSLTQGSYSLSILTALKIAPDDFNHGKWPLRLERIGELKLADRSNVLRKLRLIGSGNSPPKLTRLGRLTVWPLMAVIRLSNARSFNG